MSVNTAEAPASTKVMTGECRASYVNVLTPRLNELSGREEYSMTALIPKTDTETIAALKAAASAAKEKKWGNRIPEGVMSPIHDGDGPKPNGGSYGPECEGHYVLNVKSNFKPGLVDRNVQDIIDPSEFTSGDYCRMTLNCFAYDNARKGYSFGLNNIQVLRKGDPLGGHSRASDDFGPATSAANDEADW